MMLALPTQIMMSLYQHYTNSHEQFEIPNFPAVCGLYNTMDGQVFIDTCMHLLFLGRMKALAPTIILPFWTIK